MHAPTSQMRALRELEPPSDDEGFASVEQVPFVARPLRGAGGGRLRRGAGAEAARLGGGGRAGRPGRAAPPLRLEPRRRAGRARALAAALAREVSGPVETAVCPHPAGPPICWCRPPLPGLPLAFARRARRRPRRSTLIGNATRRTGRSRRRSAPATSRPEPSSLDSRSDGPRALHGRRRRRGHGPGGRVLPAPRSRRPRGRREPGARRGEDGRPHVLPQHEGRERALGPGERRTRRAATGSCSSSISRAAKRSTRSTRS